MIRKQPLRARPKLVSKLPLGGELVREERQQLQAVIRKGKGPARRILKARILLKADFSGGGPGWSESKIIAGLDTSASMVYRVRKQLVEEGLASLRQL